MLKVKHIFHRFESVANPHWDILARLVL